MRYAPVGNISILTALFNRSPELLGDYLLLLAHDVLEHPESYQDLLGEVRKHHKPFVTVDNSLIELDESVAVTELIQAAQDVGAQAVVAPDVLGEREATVENARAFMKRLGGTEIMPVLVAQGGHIESIKRCIDEFMHLELEDSWECIYSVPRWVTNKFGSRKEICDHIRQRDFQARIHLLGMSQHLDDDVQCAQLENVMGIDSANPITAGMKGIEFRDAYSHTTRMIAGEDYMTKDWTPPSRLDLCWRSIERNIDYVRNAIDPPQDDDEEA